MNKNVLLDVILLHPIFVQKKTNFFPKNCVESIKAILKIIYSSLTIFI